MGFARWGGLAYFEVCLSRCARHTFPHRVHVVGCQGADVLINYTEGNFKAQLKKAGVYGSIDVVYDPVGGEMHSMRTCPCLSLPDHSRKLRNHPGLV